MASDDLSRTSALIDRLRRDPELPGWLPALLPVGGTLVAAYLLFGVVTGALDAGQASDESQRGSTAPVELPAAGEDPADAAPQTPQTPQTPPPATSPEPAPPPAATEAVEAARAAAASLADGTGVPPGATFPGLEPIAAWEEVTSAEVVGSFETSDGTTVVTVLLTGPAEETLVVELSVRRVQDEWYFELL